MAFTTVAAIAGIGTAVYGAVQQRSNIKKANQQTAIANANQRRVQKASEDAAKASQAAERLREKQMELEGIRRRRDIIRSAQASTALGEARAVAQGAQDSSAAAANRNRNATQQRIDMLANLQNIEIGRGVFEQNRRITQANTRGANFQTSANIATSQSNTYMNQANYGAQFMNMGLNLAQNSVMIGNVLETSIFGSSTSAQPTNSTPNWSSLK